MTAIRSSRGRRRALVLLTTIATAFGLVVGVHAAAAAELNVVETATSIGWRATGFELQRGDKLTGNASLTIFENGAYNFTVHAHNSLAARRNYSMVCIVTSASGASWGWAHKETIYRKSSDDRTYSGVKPELATDFPNIRARWNAKCTMSAHWDVKGVWNDYKNAHGLGGGIASVVGIFT